VVESLNLPKFPIESAKYKLFLTGDHNSWVIFVDCADIDIGENVIASIVIWSYVSSENAIIFD
jgi:hypothetical protein